MRDAPGQAGATTEARPAQARPDAAQPPVPAAIGAPPATPRPPRRRWRWVRRIAGGLLSLVLLAGLGLGWAAWRLAEGPLPVPALAARLGAAAGAALGVTVELGGAALVWQGFRADRDTAGPPVELHLTDLTLRDPAGTARARAQQARVGLSLPALLRGTLAPATIDLVDLQVRLERGADGGFALGAAGDGADPAQEPDPAAMLADLMRPRPADPTLAALRRLRLQGGSVIVTDPSNRRAWRADDLGLEFRRGPDGHLSGGGQAVLHGSAAVPGAATGLPAAAPGVPVPDTATPVAPGTPVPETAAPAAPGTPVPGVTAGSTPAVRGIRVQVTAATEAAGLDVRTLRLGVTLPTLRPSELAALWPALAPLAVLDAPVQATAEATVDPGLHPLGWNLRLRVGDGTLAWGNARVPIAALALDADGSMAGVRVATARLAVAGTELTVSGTLAREGAGWRASLDGGATGALDLAASWPAALAPELRARALAAVPSLRLSRAEGSVAVTTGPGLADPRVQSGRIALAADPVSVDLGTLGRMSAAAEVALRLAPDRVELETLRLRLPPPRPGIAGPILTGQGTAALADGRWRAEADLALDSLAFVDAARYWPPGLQTAEREWLTGNVTAGTLRNARFRIAAEAPPDLATVDVTALTGRAEATDATVHWLRPVPPVTGVSGVAEFGLKEIILRTRGGRQGTGAEGGRGLEARDGIIRFHGLDTRPGEADIRVDVAGPLTDTLTLLRHPRLKLFDRRPLPLTAAGGTAEARVAVAFPLWNRLPIEDLKINVNARVADGRLTDLLLDRDFSRGAMEIVADTEGMRVTGTGQLAEVPLRLDLAMDFRAGPPGQVTERATVTGRTGARGLASLGFDTGGLLDGTFALDARAERRRNGQGTVTLRADLRETRLALDAVGYAKPSGVPGLAEGTLRLTGEAPTALDAIRIEAPDLALRGRLGFGAGARLDRIVVTQAALGASRLAGEARPPARGNDPWAVTLSGPVLDLRALLEREAPPAATPPAEPGPSPAVAAEARFERVLLGEGRALTGVNGRLRIDPGGLLREARVLGRVGGADSAFDAELARPTAPGGPRELRLRAADAGALLAAFDLGGIEGGRLSVTAAYAALRPGAPLSGTAELDEFVVQDAPAAAKLIQALSVYGIAEAVQGGRGLVFSRLIAPFTLTPEALTLGEARAYSASLGVTARGQYLRRTRVLDLEGTIVPAYLLNTALGNLPLVGRLFSPERGGGVFSATYRVSGAVADPTVTVNPLAALTPGFLRGLFGGLERPAAR